MEEEVTLIFKNKNYNIERRKLAFCKYLYEKSLKNRQVWIDEEVDDGVFEKCIMFLDKRYSVEIFGCLSDVVSLLRKWECDSCLIDSIYVHSISKNRNIIINRNRRNYDANLGMLLNNSLLFSDYYQNDPLSLFMIEDDFSDESFDIFFSFIHQEIITIPNESLLEVREIMNLWRCELPIHFANSGLIDTRMIGKNVFDFYESNEDFFAENLSIMIGNSEFCSLPIGFLISVFQKTKYILNEETYESFSRMINDSHGHLSHFVYPFIKVKNTQKKIIQKSFFSLETSKSQYDIDCYPNNFKHYEFRGEFSIETINIHHMAVIGNFNIVQYMIYNGIDVNLQYSFEKPLISPIYSFSIKNKITPLHAASFGGYFNIVKLLVENGANLNSLDDDLSFKFINAYLFITQRNLFKLPNSLFRKDHF